MPDAVCERVPAVVLASCSALSCFGNTASFVGCFHGMPVNFGFLGGSWWLDPAERGLVVMALVYLAENALAFSDCCRVT